jgi:hypothetical protein
MVNTRNNPCNG